MRRQSHTNQSTHAGFFFPHLTLGKNRPLDADELDFLDSLEAKKRKVEDSRRMEEETELLEFQLAREQALQTKAAHSSSSLHHMKQKQHTQAHHPNKKSKNTARSMMIRVKPKVKVAPVLPAKREPEAETEPARKNKAQDQSSEGVTVTGGAGLSLLADYGSESDSD